MSTANDPKTLDEYNERFTANTDIIGVGSETATLMACPFCAAPAWKRAHVVSFESDMGMPTTCSVCGRTCRATFEKESNMTTMRLVQTGGDDPPEYLRRIILRET